jgi:tetratricopeptide (TPR) repeat protein
LSQGRMILTYLKLTFWPHPLILDYGPTLPDGWTAAAPYAVVVLGLVLLTAYALWRWPGAGFLGAWFFVTLSPSSSIIPIATEVGAERRMYLPLAAVIVLIVVIGARVVEQYAAAGSSAIRPIATGAVAALVVTLMVATMQRNLEYRDQVSLWRRVLAERPHGRAHFALAIALKDLKRTDETIEEYRRATADYPEAHYALAFEYKEKGDLDAAIAEFKRFVTAVPLDSQVPNAFVLMGRALADRGRDAESIEAYRTAIVMRPKDLDARAGLADVLLEAGRYQDAVDQYKAYVALAPRDPTGHGNLARALIALGRPGEAMPEFSRAVELAPDDPKARVNYGYALATLDRLDEARTQSDAVLKRDPNDVSALDLLAIVLAAQGHRDEAAARFDQALRLDPGNRQVRSDYEAALGVKK